MIAEKTQSRSKIPQKKGPKASKKKTIHYPKDVFLAFVDPTADDPTVFKLARTRKAVYESTTEMKCDVFVLTKGLSYELTLKNTVVFASTVVKEIAKPSPSTDGK